MSRTKQLSTQTITCPDCGLVLRAIDGTTGFKCIYDMKVWRRICTRVDLGDAAWCLVQRDGTHPLIPVMDRADRSRRIADLVIVGSHCIGLELIIERLAAEGLAVRVTNTGSTRGLAVVKRDECDVAPL